MPLRNIVDPSDIDVLSGRDAYVQRHPGNKDYRKLVNANKAQYITVRKPDKMKISRTIVAAVRERGPLPGKAKGRRRANLARYWGQESSGKDVASAPRRTAQAQERNRARAKGNNTRDGSCL